MLNKFLDCLAKQGWKAERNRLSTGRLPAAVQERYPGLSREWLELLAKVKRLVRGDERAWFLCAPDYAPREEDEWRWNEWELLSLEGAEGDPSWQEEIREFWDRHFPFFLSVDEACYAYYAIDRRDGSVVWGCEPEFEVCKTVAPSFQGFLGQVIRGEISL